MDAIDTPISEFHLEDLPPSCTMIMVGSPGSGKCLAPGTPVMMADCTVKNVEYIVKGDLLMGDDSTPRTVLSVCSGRDNMYKVSQRYGDDYTVNEPHILSLKKIYNPKIVYDYNQSIFTVVWYLDNERKTRSFGYTDDTISMVKRSAEAFLDTLKADIDYTRENYIDISVTDYLKLGDDEKEGYKGYKSIVDITCTKYGPELYGYGLWLTAADFDFSDIIMARLCILGIVVRPTFIQLPDGTVLGKNDHRVFPDRFLQTQASQRGYLLTGIIDGLDLNVDDDETVSLAVDNDTALDLVSLSNSLGIHTVYKDGVVILRGSKLNTVPALCFGKNHLFIDPEDYSMSDITITSVGEGDYYGFQLDGNRRFLLGDCTVTHNTTLIENIAYYLKHRYPVARIFMGTEDGYKHLSKIFHPLYVSNYYDEDEEKNHILRQKKCALENGKGYTGNYAINIVDDAADVKTFKSSIFRALFKLGSQHWHQLFMVGSQYAIDLPPDVRKSVSYVAVFFEAEEPERKKLYNNFGGLAGSYENFCNLMDTLCGDYTCLIFKKRTQSTRIEDNIFYYQTKPLPPWKFGSKEYRENAEARFNKNYVEEAFV